MYTDYVQIIVMLHAAFAGVFYFLFRQSGSRFAGLFAAGWTIEAVRAAILLPGVRALGGADATWFAVSDVLCFPATWWLLAGCAALAGVRLPRWLGPAYFWSGVPVVLFNRYLLGPVFAAWGGTVGSDLQFHGLLANMIIMFVPVAVARGAVVVWLWRIWRKERLPGAMVAVAFGVPYAVVALAVPFQFYYGGTPDWVALLWCARVLGFSIGLVMLTLNLQQLAVAKSEAGLAAAQALAKIGSWELDVRTQVATWSAEMYRLYDRAPAAGVPSYQEFLMVLHPEDRKIFERTEAAGLRERRSTDHEFRVMRPDGSVKWIQGRNTPIFNVAGELVRQLGVEQDVTERKRAEARAALQHAVTQVLAEARPIESTMERILGIIGERLGARCAAFWTADRRRVLRCAQQWPAAEAAPTEFAELTRRTELAAGQGLPGRVLAERAAVVVEEAELLYSANHPRRHAAARAGLRSGGAFPILVRAEAYGVVEFFATEPQAVEPELRELLGALGAQIGQFIERQRLEEQYRQSQKMEAVGTLAGGIAHDFNNVLTAISGYCELAQIELPADAPAAPHLQAVRDGARRAAELVRQIMAFSRQQAPQRQPLVLSGVVDEAVKLLRATIPATVEIRTQHELPLPRVLADATSIHQIVVNLSTNACHAMKDRPGRLTVGVTALTVDADFAQAHPGLRAGGYVRLTVEDTGSGMDAATVARIFEPFFTTKAPGEGTGLGLSVVHGIVQNHDGAVFVYSQPGEGTRFQIYFPVHDGEAAEEPGAEESLPRGRGEAILYVEDEVALAKMGRQMLQRLGYAAVVHGSPLTALAAFKERPRAFAALVTDLTMPGMTGLELARQVRALRSDLPVLLMSGYAATLTPEKLEGTGVRELLTKPHSLSGLARAIERVLR